MLVNRATFITIFLLVLSLFSTQVYGENYAVIGGGYSASNQAPNVSAEINYLIADSCLVGGGITSVFHYSDIPNNFYNYPINHNSFTSLGTRSIDLEIGFYGKAGWELFAGKKLFLCGISGVTFGKEIELVQSNISGSYCGF